MMSDHAIRQLLPELVEALDNTTDYLLLHLSAQRWGEPRPDFDKTSKEYYKACDVLVRARELTGDDQ
jgi:hypothetical protein